MDVMLLMDCWELGRESEEVWESLLRLEVYKGRGGSSGAGSRSIRWSNRGAPEDEVISGTFGGFFAAGALGFRFAEFSDIHVVDAVSTENEKVKIF